MLDTRLATARELYDKGTHRRLLAALPGLIADGHAAARSRRELDQARLSSVYSLAAAVLSKLGSYEQARLTADRARTWAEVSGSPLASAAAARELAIVLRHQNRNEEAQRLMSTAATGVESTGLRTDVDIGVRPDALHPGLHRRPGRTPHRGSGDDRGSPPRRRPSARDRPGGPPVLHQPGCDFSFDDTSFTI